MVLDEGAQRRDANRGHVAVSDQHVAAEVLADPLDAAARGVAGAALTVLQSERQLARRERAARGFFDLARLMADDHDQRARAEGGIERGGTAR